MTGNLIKTDIKVIRITKSMMLRVRKHVLNCVEMGEMKGYFFFIPYKENGEKKSKFEGWFSIVRDNRIQDAFVYSVGTDRFFDAFNGKRLQTQLTEEEKRLQDKII